MPSAAIQRWNGLTTGSHLHQLNKIYNTLMMREGNYAAWDMYGLSSVYRVLSWMKSFVKVENIIYHFKVEQTAIKLLGLAFYNHTPVTDKRFTYLIKYIALKLCTTTRITAMDKEYIFSIIMGKKKKLLEP